MPTADSLLKDLKPESLSDKVILVTSGTSPLGQTTCATFAAAGAMVLIGDTRESRAAQIAASLREPGGRAHAVRLDITDQSDLQRVVEKTMDTYGRLDMIVMLVSHD